MEKYETQNLQINMNKKQYICVGQETTDLNLDTNGVINNVKSIITYNRFQKEGIEGRL